MIHLIMDVYRRYHLVYDLEVINLSGSSINNPSDEYSLTFYLPHMGMAWTSIFTKEYVDGIIKL